MSRNSRVIQWQVDEEEKSPMTYTMFTQLLGCKNETISTSQYLQKKLETFETFLHCFKYNTVHLYFNLAARNRLFYGPVENNWTKETLH